MKAEKKKLETLKVQSFVTNDQKSNVLGGDPPDNSWHHLCPDPFDVSQSADGARCCMAIGSIAVCPEEVCANYPWSRY